LHILKWELDGRILMSFKPPNFHSDYTYLKDEIEKEGRQAISMAEGKRMNHSDENNSDEDDDKHDQPIGKQSLFS
ncbi:hypothetical protein GGI12_005475, partial [Dipsacomyces acuminosporus]